MQNYNGHNPWNLKSMLKRIFSKDALVLSCFVFITQADRGCISCPALLSDINVYVLFLYACQPGITLPASDEVGSSSVKSHAIINLIILEVQRKSLSCICLVCLLVHRQVLENKGKYFQCSMTGSMIPSLVDVYTSHRNGCNMYAVRSVNPGNNVLRPRSTLC